MSKQEEEFEIDFDVEDMFKEWDDMKEVKQVTWLTIHRIIIKQV